MGLGSVKYADILLTPDANSMNICVKNTNENICLLKSAVMESSNAHIAERNMINVSS